MISEEMKQTKHYRMYANVFRIDVPLIQSLLTESTQGTHRTPSAPRLPTPKVDASASTRLNVILLRLSQWKSIRLTPPAPVLTINNPDELILQDTLQEIEKMVEGQEHVVDDSFIPRNDEHNILGTREKRKNVEESRITPFSIHFRSPRIHTDLVSLDTEKLQELTVPYTTSSSSSPSTKLSHTNRLLSLFKVKPTRFKRYKSFFQELQGRYGYLFEHLRAKFMPRKSFVILADHLHEAMTDSLPTVVDKHIKEQVEKQVPESVRNQVPVYVAEGLILERQKTKEEMEKMIAKAILQKHGNIQAQISSQIQQAIVNDIPSQVDAFIRSYMSRHNLHVHPTQPQTTSVPEQQYQLAKRQKTSEYEAYVSGESSSGQDNEQEQGPSTSGDEHQYHIDQMKNFMKSDIISKSRKEILVSPHPRKTTPLVLSCQRDPKAPALSLINQDLLYLKKGNSRLEKIVLSLHKFLAVVFNDDDIKEQTSRWVNKCVKKFNPYARYGVEHWKNPYAKIFYIRKQKEPRKPKEKVNLTAPKISFPEVKKHEMFSIIYEPVHEIIYKNSKKEKRVMRHSEIHKFCDATLNRVLEGLKSYNNDVRYGYNQRYLTKYKVEYLKLFEKEIEDRFKYRRQTRRWESYVNGRSLGQRRERPE
uniref:Uncharacterized protein n=1 Tax=Tanacetum cinerariifolium TaxID=118510 RepID=A0A6L2LQJ2_TANCI|nr:hypothetical protein [Tanacetum cinerariifolium]